jgi:5-methyltetrahydropteroyltriglutamate--homocysteine methyltransferase
MSSGSAHLKLSSTGSYPRVSDSPESQLLERTAASFARGERTSADLLDAQNTVTRRAIAEQVKAGLEIITDGHIRWNDPISHLAAKLGNVSLRGSLPFFATQKRFRQPVCDGKPVRHGLMVVDEYSFARNALGHLPTPPSKAGKFAIKPVLTGPYTLAKFSDSEVNGSNGGSAHRDRLEERALGYAEVLAQEIDALAQSGAHLIQIDEPAILNHHEDWSIFEAAIARLADARDIVKKANRKLDLALYTYFGDAAPLYEKLLALPVDILGFDFASSPSLVEKIATAGSPKSLALGFVDGCKPEMENSAVVAKHVDRLLPKINGSQVFLGTSCGLEYLSSPVAFAKLSLLTTVLSELTGTSRV